MLRRRVLVARLDSMGDVLLAGPAVRAVAASGAEVAMLCSSRGAEAAGMLPGVSRVIPFDAPWILADPSPVSPAAVELLVGRLSMGGFQEGLVLTSFHQSALPTALLMRLAGIPRIAAYSEDYPGSLVDVRLKEPGDVHEVERALSLASALGHRLPEQDGGELRVAFHASPIPEVAHLPGYVVLHPGASAPARAWPADRFKELARLLRRSSLPVVVTGSASERGLGAKVAGNPGPDVADLTGRLDLAGLAATLAGARAVVVGNTGPAHLAAAVGTPVVSLFAPTVPYPRWRPWKVPTIRLGDQNAQCAGTRSVKCPLEGHPCLGSVSADEAAEAVQRLLLASFLSEGVVA